jgi:hypothetical protein
MATILIILVLNLGQISGIYVGEYDSPKVCERAIPAAIEKYGNDKRIVEAEAATILCVPKQEA